MLTSPRTLRDTFELLAGLRRDTPLEQFLATIDWTGATPQQVCTAALGRLPQDIHYSNLTRAAFDPMAYYRTLLLGAEFQSAIVPNLLGAFPEKARHFFVHVPRCGGTSLGETLALHACTLPQNALGADWCGGRVFLDAVSDICRGIPAHDAIHVSGHYSLRTVVEDRLARFGDSIWTVVRPPADILMSYMNYILTVLDRDPDLTRPDAQHWARLLGLRMPVARMSPEQLRGLLPRMIREDQLLPRDLLCHFLGDGTAASAVDLLAAADVEVIDSAGLDQWRERRWGVPPPPWRNQSRSFFRWETLHDAERALLSGLIRQDFMLHEVIRAAFGTTRVTSGLMVAQAAQSQSIRPPGAASTTRVPRARRPILRDAIFKTMPGGQVGWADPPLRYRTLETTLRFPGLDTRIRIRYARRETLKRPAGARPVGGKLARLLAFLGGWRALRRS